MNNIVGYYNNEYNEENRLSKNCDNRHKVEREVKIRILKNVINTHNIKTIGDICCGTGLYSLLFAKEGYNVKACDIVPKHIDILNQKSKEKELDIESYVCDAKNTPFKDNCFDMTLLAGAIYHTHNDLDKIKLIKEAKRITKPNGIIVVDYLSDVHGYIQHVLLDNDYLKKKNNMRNIDYVFSYDNNDRMKYFGKMANIELLYVAGTDSITRFIQNDINKLDDNNLNLWIDFIYNNSNKSSIIDMSEHCLAIYKNN